MGESARHMALANRMREWVVTDLFDGDSGGVRFDAPSSSRQGKPPFICGYVPDLYGETVHPPRLVIGEAKIAQDVENGHTVAQLTAFLMFCAARPHSVMVLAVPWHLTRYARQMVRQLAAKCHAENVRCVVMDGLEG